MGLSFLAPLFLAGLIALGIPVWIHLIQRQRGQVVRFPSLMFLERIPYKSVRRQKIRHWLLLLLRSAALALVIAAFARPLLENDSAGGSGFLGAREVVILLDRSYSMGYGGRWDQARHAVRTTISELDREDRATLVYFDVAAHAAREPSTDHARLLSSLETAAVGAASTRYGPPLKLAQSILESSALPRKEVILVSDFQRVGFEDEVGVLLPEGTEFTPISVAGPGSSNLTVGGVTFRRQAFAGQTRVSVTARIVSRSPDPVEKVDVVLSVSDLVMERRSVDLEANGSATVTFDPVTVPGPFTTGTVSAGEDPLPEDNRFHFVLSPEEAVPVLVLDGGGSSSLYLRQALEIGSEPPFAVTVKRASQFRAADLSGSRVVVLNDASLPGGGAGDRIRDFVSSGGGLLVVAGDRTGWSAESADLLPGTIGSPVTQADRKGGKLGYLDYSHPALEIFSAPRSGDFTGARFYRYRPLEMNGSQGVLARFDDGTIALVEKRIAEGSVMVLSSTLDAVWNDLVLQPVFLPLVHQLIKHMASYRPPRAWATVGQVVALDQWNIGAVPGWEEAHPVVVTPSKQRIPLDVGRQGAFIQASEQGFFQVEEPDAGGRRLAVLAANLDPQESDLTPLDPRVISEAIGVGGNSGEVSPPPEATTPEDRERRQSLWWYLLATAFLLLATETVVANRLSRIAR
jgi:hypothetical protein